MRVRIEKMGINGEGIGYINKKPVFIPEVLIGEEVDVEVEESFRTYAVGRCKKMFTFSDERITPKCNIQRRCGACPLMVTNYKNQCAIKFDSLKQSLIKYAQVNPRLIQPMITNNLAFNYRNQFKLPFSMNEERQLTTGMYQPNSNYFNEIEKCVIHERDLERVRLDILKVLNDYECKAYDYHQKRGFRSLVVRGFDEQYQVTFVTGDEELSPYLIEKVMSIRGVVSLWQSINVIKKTPEIFGPKMILLAGERYLTLNFQELKLNLSPRSFFQLNTQQAVRLYETVAKMIPDGQKFILEAYSGIGGISMFLKDKAEEIIGIESVKDAVVNANANAKENKADNVSFICADAADKATYYSKTRTIDVLVVDPPRSGLDEAMIDCILKSKIKTVIYISCNPATLGKNLAILQDRYEVKTVQPIDMFSQTAHIECIVKLVRR